MSDQTVFACIIEATKKRVAVTPRSVAELAQQVKVAHPPVYIEPGKKYVVRLLVTEVPK